MTAWPKVPVRRLFRIVNGGTPPADADNWNGDVPWATPADLALVNGSRLRGTARTLTAKGLRRSALVPAGSLIISTRAPIGYVVESSTPVSFNQGCRALVAIAEIETRFFLYQLLSLTQEMNARGQGTTFAELGTDALASIQLHAPPLGQQRSVASFLDAETARIDALIEKKRQMLALLDERLRALARALILRSVDPVTGSGDLPADWQRCRLGVAITLHRGFDLPESERREGVIPVISSGVRAGSHEVAACAPPGVVTGRYGTVGAVHFVDEPFWPLNTTLFVSDFRGNDARWVYHLLRVLPLDIDAEKSAVSGINRNVVGALNVPLPPRETQTELARRLDEKERQKLDLSRALVTQMQLLVEHRQGLITAAVTGQLNVAVAA